METEKRADNDVDKLAFRERLTIATLCFTNLINFMDRFSIAGILLYIQADFNIEDDVAGFIHTGFVLGYIVVSPLMGYLGDRFPRRYMLMIILVIWIVVGFVNTIVDDIIPFIGTRVIVGACQAGFNIMAPGLLSDIAVGRKRIAVFGIFFFASPVGTGLGLMVAPKINRLTKGMWWWGLRPMPMALCISLVLMMFCVDPIRGAKDAALLGGKPAARTSYYEDIHDILTTKSFLLIVAAFAFASFITAAFGWWRPKSLSYGYILIMGENGTNDAKIVGRFGFILIVTGILGVSLGSGLSRALRPKYPFVDPLICGVGMFLAMPFNMLSNYFTPINVHLALFFGFFGQTTMNFNWAVVMDMLMYVVVPMRRASAKAIETFLSHIVGNVIGGVLVGAISEFYQSIYDFSTWHDHVTHNESNFNYEKIADEFYGLQYSLFTIMVAFVFSAVLFFITAFYIVADKERATAKSLAKE